MIFLLLGSAGKFSFSILILAGRFKKGREKTLEEEIMVLLCYRKCSTCRKAKKWLDEHNIEYKERDIVEENPSYDELKDWYQKSGFPLKRFFNTSGLLYREMQLKDKLASMNEDEQWKLLASNGMLVKRPILVDEDIVLTGFRETEWEEKLLGLS